MSGLTFLKQAIAKERATFGTYYPVSSSPLSPQTELKTSTVECICNRPVQSILCRSCGNIFEGRIRKCCPIHTKSIHLMDHSFCPQCRTIFLEEFTTPSKHAAEPATEDTLRDTENDFTFKTRTG